MQAQAQEHRQRLLARIAIERAELTLQLDGVRRAARGGGMLRAALGAGLLKGLFGAAAGASGPGYWLHVATALLRRYPLVASVLAGAAPLLRGRHWLRRALLGAALAAAAWVGWRATRLGGAKPQTRRAR